MLRNCWNRLPIPAGCVALGLIGLGTLLSAYSRLFLFLLGLLSFAIQICVLMKLLRSGSLKRLYADRASLSQYLAHAPLSPTAWPPEEEEEPIEDEAVAAPEHEPRIIFWKTDRHIASEPEGGVP